SAPLVSSSFQTPPTSPPYTLSLHDALPIFHPSGLPHGPHPGLAEKSIGMTETHELAVMCDTFRPLKLSTLAKELDDGKYAYSWRSEEHTSELQSPYDLVCRLLLEKKKKKII